MEKSYYNMIGIFPIIAILVHTIGTWTTTLSLSTITLIITAISVPIMTYIVTPQLEIFFKKWLFSKPLINKKILQKKINNFSELF
jgi:antibiotic biosynthesis monooxygenase (ABM) superfamily enzyme